MTDKRDQREVLKFTPKRNREAVKKLLAEVDKLAKKLAKHDISLTVF